MTILDSIFLAAVIGCIFWTCLSFHRWCNEYFGDD